MNKRGQLFILAAIIICVLVYQVTAKYNTAKEYGGVEGFNEKKENYINEIRILYNKDKLEGKTEKEIIGSISAFSREYKKFVKKEDPNMGFLFIYKDEEGIVHIENLLGEGREILLRYRDPSKADETVLKIHSIEERTEGIINLAFMGSMGKIKVSTPLVNFGEEFVMADIENAEELTIEIPGVGSIPIPNLETLRHATLTISEETLEGERIHGGEEEGVEVIIRDVSYQQN